MERCAREKQQQYYIHIYLFIYIFLYTYKGRDTSMHLLLPVSIFLDHCHLVQEIHHSYQESLPSRDKFELEIELVLAPALPHGACQLRT